MKILFLVFHPNLKGSKVNAAWTAEARKQPNFTVKDMGSLYPDFQFDVRKEQQDLLDHNRIVLQFPFYWFNVPSLLKKWLEDVLTYGFAYGPRDKLQLKGKELALSVSVGGSADSYMPGGHNNYSIPELLRPMQQTAFLCGMTYCRPFWMHDANTATPELAKDYGIKMIKHVSNPAISDPWNHS